MDGRRRIEAYGWVSLRLPTSYGREGAAVAFRSRSAEGADSYLCACRVRGGGFPPSHPDPRRGAPRWGTCCRVKPSRGLFIQPPSPPSPPSPPPDPQLHLHTTTAATAIHATAAATTLCCCHHSRRRLLLLRRRRPNAKSPPSSRRIMRRELGGLFCVMLNLNLQLHCARAVGTTDQRPARQRNRRT